MYRRRRKGWFVSPHGVVFAVEVLGDPTEGTCAVKVER